MKTAGKPDRSANALEPSRGPIRAQVLVLCALLLAFILSGSLSFWYGTRLERMLESSLQQNILMLGKLPELRNGVREINSLTELYFKTGEASALEKRRRAVAGLMGLYEELRSLPAAEPAQNILSRFDRELKSFLDLQQGMIQASQSQSLRKPDRQERKALRNRRDEILEIISTFGERSALKLQASEFRVRRTSGRLYIARFAVEILIAVLAAFYILFYVLRPLRAVQKIATRWKLGTPWPAQTLSSLPEIRSLITHFGDMAARLNSEFGKVQQFSRFKTKLVSVVSHEFGNALAVMASAVFLLRENLPPDWLKENEHLLDMISSNITGLAGAAHNLLDMGRHEAGQLAVDFAPTDAAEILGNVMERLELLYKKRNLQASVKISDGLQPVRADPAALTLIVSNLMSNAIKYTPPGGRIVLGILREGSHPEHHRVFVQDTGIGISREDVDKILGGASYYRTKSGKAMTPKGFGIGLSLVKLMIEAHGSTLELESSPGKGSRFSFLLPVHGSAGHPLGTSNSSGQV